jgi:hypothetical protein
MDIKYSVIYSKLLFHISHMQSTWPVPYQKEDHVSLRPRFRAGPKNLEKKKENRISKTSEIFIKYLVMRKEFALYYR